MVTALVPHHDRPRDRAECHHRGMNRSVTEAGTDEVSRNIRAAAISAG
ncbi:hypothetical protein [Kineosporia sp. NBRC 101731]|nr:hypothetical protein [Kineosporia sp. NBRC 101731]